MIKKTPKRPSECDLGEAEYFEFIDLAEGEEFTNAEAQIQRGLTFPNARDPFYGIEFHNRDELEGFILRLRSAANQLWGEPRKLQ
jgi:hypothetical protein